MSVEPLRYATLRSPDLCYPFLTMVFRLSYCCLGRPPSGSFVWSRMGSQFYRRSLIGSLSHGVKVSWGPPCSESWTTEDWLAFEAQNLGWVVRCPDAGYSDFSCCRTPAHCTPTSVDGTGYYGCQLWWSRSSYWLCHSYDCLDGPC